MQATLVPGQRPIQPEGQWQKERQRQKKDNDKKGRRRQKDYLVNC